MRLKTSSAEKTQAVAALLAKELDAKAPHPFVVGLSGELGSGKTTFIQGFARALGIKRRLLSPTFLLMRSYKLPRLRGRSHSGEVKARTSASYRTLFHLDAYRLRHAGETEALKFKEVLRDPRNIVLIEWAENIRGALPRGAIRMRFTHGRKTDERSITIGK